VACVSPFWRHPVEQRGVTVHASLRAILGLLRWRFTCQEACNISEIKTLPDRSS
jgi:hypothetical protein